MPSNAEIVRRFIRDDDRGGLTILMLVLFIGIMLMTGIALDLTKHETQRASLQSALDRGVLAVTSVRGNARAEDAREIIETYVNTRPFAEGTFTFVDPASMAATPGATIYNTPWLSLNADLENINSRSVSAAAAYPMDTTFMRLIGQRRLPVPAQSAAIQTIKNIEISLVIDISGTMRWRKGNNNPAEGTSRMETLKPAAIEFINTVTENGASEFVTVNLVPYAGGVNLGQTAFSILSGRTLGETPLVTRDLNQTRLVDLGIGHRTFAQLDLDALTDDILEVDITPSEFGVTDFEDITPQQLADVGIDVTLAHALAAGVSMYEINWSNVVAANVNLPDGLRHPFSFCLDIDQFDTSEYDSLTVPSVGVHTTQVEHFNYYGYNRYAHGNQIMEWGWCPSAETEIVYMSNSAAVLNDRIQNMLMNDGTGTYAAMKWATALLHPGSRWFIDEMANYGAINSRYATGGDDVRPAALDDENTNKYIVLMTDGNVNYDYRLDNPTDPNWWHDGRAAGGANTYTRMSQTNGRNTFLDICADAKATFENLRVFTIAFDVNSTSIENEMRTCASSSSDFFTASTIDIAATFRTIAEKINDLKLTN